MEMGIRVIRLEIRSPPEEEHTGCRDGVAACAVWEHAGLSPRSLRAGGSHCQGGEGESALGGAGRDRAGQGAWRAPSGFHGRLLEKGSHWRLLTRFMYFRKTPRQQRGGGIVYM